MFCFSVMLPWGYEPNLLQMQHDTKTSIFACEAWSVYTNDDVELDGFVPTKVNVSLNCEKEGVYHTFYNTPIFIKIWQHVVLDRRIHSIDWVVKVDPDAVLLPVRLRAFLVHHGDDFLETAANNAGIFVNNCKFGLHGPFELISRRALEVYAQYRKICESDEKRPPQEDVYLQKCLVKLGVKQVDDFDLMVEDHCEPPTGWEDCRSDHAVFHPFKTRESYSECRSNAEAHQAQEDYERK